MAQTSAQITEASPGFGRFTMPLVAIAALFSCRSESGSDRDTSRRGRGSSDRLPPPARASGSTAPIPGEPVDTSHHRPVQTPADSAGVSPSQQE